MSLDLAAGWTAIVGASQESLDCWAALVARWSEPHRRYHGMAHLTAVLLFVDEYAAHATDPDAVRLAGWYHDAVYDPRAADNEERSAVLAERELPALGVGADRVDEVARLVRLTVAHEPPNGDRNGELLNDADLLILASPAEAYVGYLNAIREEYAHVSDDAFRVGRAAIVSALLDSPRLFRLAALAPLEVAARRNMSAELSLLRPDPGESDPLLRPDEDDAAADAADRPDEARPGPPGH